MSNPKQTVAGHPLDRSLRSEGFDPVQKLREGQSHLHAGQASAETDVDTEAECHVAIGRTRNVKSEGIIEHGGIAVGRHLPVGDLVACLDLVTLVAHVACCRATLMDGGRGPAQDLVYCNTHLADVCSAQPLNLLWLLHQGVQASGNGATCCLGSGGKQQHEEVEQLFISKRSARAVIFVRVKLGGY